MTKQERQILSRTRTLMARMAFCLQDWLDASSPVEKRIARRRARFLIKKFHRT